MNKDKYLRKINYLRVSITDKCNFRCIYCMPEAGIQLKNHSEILSLEEFIKLISLSAEMGINKVRITGGEPLVRKGIVDFISEINKISGIDDISLTTNGALLKEKAVSLKEAGLSRVNISLDTLDESKFISITRTGDLQTVLAGIEKSIEVGFEPVKLNVVIMAGFNENEIFDFVELTREKPLHVRFIELMPIGETEKWDDSKYISSEAILNLINNKYQIINSTGIKGAGPAKYMTVVGHQGTIGFISALSNHFCSQCNRLRLTSEGMLRPCLHGSKEIDLRTPLRSGFSDDRLKEIILQALWEKPMKHSMKEEGWKAAEKMMYQIGG
ncbi:MAG: GTP 3',8-cyclase MoaA [Bacillota bacterium]|nr:GTP 3',8-cyclase MoaA [Bacillota bacterium]